MKEEFVHCGRQVKTGDQPDGSFHITLDQQRYVAEMCAIPQPPGDPTTKHVEDEAHSDYRGIVGQCQCFSKECGIGYAFEVHRLATRLAGPTNEHIRTANKLLSRVQPLESSRCLRFRPPTKKITPVIYIAGDSGFKSNDDQTSQCGYVVCLLQPLGDGSGLLLAVLHWRSAKIARVCNSRMTSEIRQHHAFG